MRVLRRSKTWILLSLLAMLGVVVTPAMAFNCCCASLPGSPPDHHPEPKAQAVPNAAVPPSCHGHAAQPVVAETPVIPEKAEQCHAPKGSGSKPDSASLSSIEPVCHCPQIETPPATCTDTASVFASLGLPADLPVALWNVTAPATPIAWFLADGAFGPRAPWLSSHSGRAPPAI